MKRQAIPTSNPVEKGIFAYRMKLLVGVRSRRSSAIRDLRAQFALFTYHAADGVVSNPHIVGEPRLLSQYTVDVYFGELAFSLSVCRGDAKR